MFTLCGNCRPTGQPVTTINSDCDPTPVGGGGGGPVEEPDVEDEEQTDFSGQIDEETPSSCEAWYRGRVYKKKSRKTGILTRVWADRAVCDYPTKYDCLHNEKLVRRVVELQYHRPFVSRAGGGSWRVRWRFYTYFRYYPNDGSSVYTWTGEVDAIRTVS